MRLLLTLIASAWLMPLTAAGQALASWSTPPGCPSAGEARAQIARLVGDASGERGKTPAAVVIRRAPERMHEAVISWSTRGEARQRVLRDADCAALSRAAAVVVALAFTSSARARAAARPAETAPLQPAAPSAAGRSADARAPSASAPAETSPSSPGPARADASHGSISPRRADASPSNSGRADASPGSATPAQPSPTPNPSATLAAAESSTHIEPSAEAEASEVASAEQVDRPESSPEPAGDAQPTAAIPIHPFVAVSGDLRSGVLPNLAPGVELSGGVSIAAFCASLRLSYAPAQRAWLDNAAGAGGRLALAAAALEVGPRWRIRGLEFPVMVGFEAGVFDARGAGLMPDRTTRTLWLGAYLGTGLMFEWSRGFAVGVTGDLLVPLRRPGFAAEAPNGEPRVFYRPQRLSQRATLRIEARFP